MKHKLNLLTDVELIQLYQSNNSDSNVTEVLLKRYEAMLKKLAINHLQKFPNTSFEDNLQNANLGAFIAFKRFTSKSDCKPSTFIYSTIFHYLLTCNDEESFVNCPTNLREVKSYLGGKYDTNPQKKITFENKYNINTNKDVDNLSEYYKLLNPECIQVMDSDEIPEGIDYIETSIIDNIQNSMFLETLSEENQAIVKLLVDGHSQANIAKLLSNKENSVSVKQIYTKVNSIKKKIVEYYYG